MVTDQQERARLTSLLVDFEAEAAAWGASASLVEADGFKARAADYRRAGVCSQAAADRIRARLAPTAPLAETATWGQMQQALISAEPSSFGSGFLGFLRWARHVRRALRAIRRRR